MSWRFSQALVEASLLDISLDGAPCAQWSGTVMPPTSSSPDRTTAAYPPSPSGMTSVLLTDDHGEAVLTSFLAASPAKTSASQGKAQASTEPSLGSGESSPASSERSSQAGSSLRTRHSLCTAGLTSSSQLSRNWGTMRSGVCSVQPRLAPPIDESAFGLWPTPTVKGNYNKRGLSSRSGNGLSTEVRLCELRLRGLGSETRLPPLNPDWVDWLMGWPIGWTDCGAMATGRFQQWLRLHGPCSRSA